MNELEQRIMDIISTKPDCISSIEIKSRLPGHKPKHVMLRLNSLRKFGFIDRTKEKIGIGKVHQYYWRIHRDGNRYWNDDFAAELDSIMGLKHRQRVAELLEQWDEMEVWA